MFRDDRDAMLNQNQALSKETENLRADNQAMRDELLAMRRAGGPMQPYQFNIYQADVRSLSPGDRAALSYHTVTPFPVWAVALLNVFTFGLFPLIHFGLHHDKLPRAMPNDPTSGRAIGFSFIPYFNIFYWVFFNSMRLSDRLNLQLRLRGLPPSAPKGLMIACGVLSAIPYVNIVIGFPIMWTIGVCFLQHAANQVAALGPLADGGAPMVPGLDPYAQPPAGLITK